MNKCECYKVEVFNGKQTSYCQGTKDTAACSCGGDKSKCDFYETVRQQGMEEEPLPTISALTFLKQQKRMCDAEGDNNCFGCGYYACLASGMSCDNFAEENPEKAIKIVYNWAKNHPEYPTWKEWLYSIYKYYNGFSHKTFEEWLNTKISKEEAEHWNIGAIKYD